MKSKILPILLLSSSVMFAQDLPFSANTYFNMARKHIDQGNQEHHVARRNQVEQPKGRARQVDQFAQRQDSLGPRSSRHRILPPGRMRRYADVTRSITSCGVVVKGGITTRHQKLV